MIDIVERLRRWTFSPDAQPRGDLMDEAADEIERLRDGASKSRETVQQEPVAWAAWFRGENAPDGDFCWPTPHEQARQWCDQRDARLVPLYRAPQPTLTDEEREAVEASMYFWSRGVGPHAVVLRDMLERLK